MTFPPLLSPTSSISPSVPQTTYQQTLGTPFATGPTKESPHLWVPLLASSPPASFISSMHSRSFPESTFWTPPPLTSRLPFSLPSLPTFANSIPKIPSPIYPLTQSMALPTSSTQRLAPKQHPCYPLSSSPHPTTTPTLCTLPYHPRGLSTLHHLFLPLQPTSQLHTTILMTTHSSNYPQQFKAHGAQCTFGYLLGLLILSHGLCSHNLSP